jgi:ribose/xylose/arabinose/galactoside ABC-type transport system permease subunit
MSPVGKRGALWSRLLGFQPQIILLALLIAAGISNPKIVALANLKNVLIQATPIALLALGAMVVLIAGGIDLSAGFGVGLCAVIIASKYVAGGSLVSALAWGVGAGLLLGLVNGLVVGLLGIPAFVATLGSMVAVEGITLMLASANVLVVQDPTLVTIANGYLGPIPASLIAVALVSLIVAILLRQTSFGLRAYAVGSNAEAAGLSGVDLAREQVYVFLFSGLMTALTGALLVGRVSIVSPNIGGLDLLLDALAATVIGGTSIFGGRGTVIGTMTGALIISLVTNMLIVYGVNASSLDIFKGLIIILALGVDAGIRTAQARLRARQATPV